MSILNGFKQEVRSELPETRFKMSVLDTVQPLILGWKAKTGL